MKKVTFVLSIIILASSCAWSSTLFYEDFEIDLSRWTGQEHGPHHGILVDDPLRSGNTVLSFNELGNGGDIFHEEGISLIVGNTYQISFEYLGFQIPNASIDNNFGGFFGISYYIGNPYYIDKSWLFGTSESYPFLRGHLIDDGQWHIYTYTFEWQRSEIDAPGDMVHIMMEDWISAGGTYGDVFFDNVTFIEVIPEPCTLALLALGGLLLGKKPLHKKYLCK